jgi:hypothetical protein
MSIAISTLQVRGLAKRQFAEVAKRAGRLGMTPEQYLRYLLEQDLAVSHRARTTTFGDLMGPGRKVDEDDLDRVVEKAKAKHHRLSARKK